MTKKNPRLTKYRRSLNINIGVIIFGVTFVYIIISTILYLTKNKVTFYEVTAGSSSYATQKYTGIALRNEKIFYADRDGYINYYVREGNRVNVTSTLYSLDDSGTLKNLLKDLSTDGNQLSDSNMNVIKEQLSAFSTAYQDMNFDSVYDFKFDLESTILELINSNSLSSINKTLADSGKEYQIEIKKAAASGVVVYSVDNYETKNAEKITKSDFDESKYKKANFTSNMKVEKGDPIYKTVNDEMWDIIIPLSKEQQKTYKDKKSISIKFLKDDITTTGSFEIISDKDGVYGKITLNNYMTRYASERFLKIEILDTPIKGLKVPKSAVVKKDFYTVPVEYAITSSDGSSISFRLQRQNDKGKETTEEIEPTIYNKTDKYYLIDQETLHSGDILIQKDSSKQYQVNAKKTIQGVYNINSGYTMFREINILAEANDYYIVESGNNYGLSMYDHIVLEGDSVNENQVVFQ